MLDVLIAFMCPSSLLQLAWVSSGVCERVEEHEERV